MEEGVSFKRRLDQYTQLSEESVACEVLVGGTVVDGFGKMAVLCLSDLVPGHINDNAGDVSVVGGVHTVLTLATRRYGYS